jgi:hypothetical protein
MYKTFPPGLNHLKVPTGSRKVAVAALTLYAPCSPLAVRGQWIASLCVRVLGTWSLPGKTIVWAPPMDAAEWDALCDEWRRDLGVFERFAVYERTQLERAGLMLLLFSHDAPVAFVKLRRADDAARLQHEYSALQAVQRYGPRTFRAPVPVSVGVTGGWSYLSQLPLPAQLHRVAVDPPLLLIQQEIDTALAHLQRPAQVPPHWRPMHGDLTPWNLRELQQGGLILYDWEDVSWAPPGADLVLYDAALAAVTGRTAVGGQPREAVEYWIDHICTRQSSNRRDEHMHNGLVQALSRMEISSRAELLPNPRRDSGSMRTTSV